MDVVAMKKQLALTTTKNLILIKVHTTGTKPDPFQVSRDFRHERNENGERRFALNEYLSPQQIRHIFLRRIAINIQKTQIIWQYY